MNLNELIADHRLLGSKVIRLEEVVQRLLQYVERERQAAIMLVGQADDALGKERTIPKHEHRRPK